VERPNGVEADLPGPSASVMEGRDALVVEVNFAD